MLCMFVKIYRTKWLLRIINSKGASMFEYFFFYSIANRKNRISDNEEDNETDLESVSDIEVDVSGMSYSYNVIILN